MLTSINYLYLQTEKKDEGGVNSTEWGTFI